MEGLKIGVGTSTFVKLKIGVGFNGNRKKLSDGYLCYEHEMEMKKNRKSVIVAAKNKEKSVDKHSFVSRPDEATGPYPEAVLLKQKKVQQDGSLLPDFADADEQELFEYLNLQLETDLNHNPIRHYEVVYLIHEKHHQEVPKVNDKLQDFLREKKGKTWRLNDWGLRRLAYKIQKATSAHYMLMNFELEAKWINDFKTLLDKDERVIRHLVIKRDEPITENSPPPPEFQSLRAGMDDDDDDDNDDDEGEDWDDDEDGIILVNSDDDIIEDPNNKLTSQEV